MYLFLIVSSWRILCSVAIIHPQTDVIPLKNVQIWSETESQEDVCYS
ncbi:Protein of unknown function [Bacillus wiedmannii]|uniref:Uncharacterized protein n=1 Tax=Bacillus wiedmannii TaxID=1890302 RepID=A0A1C3ZMF4_9BACI|nr:Protein of unknown function [Bacillus wiedmannii]